NVALMNFCYDIPVKLYSSFYLFLSIYLISFDSKRIFQFLILRKPADPAPVFQQKPRWRKYVWAAFATGIIIFYGFYLSYSQFDEIKKYFSRHPKYYGSYDV